MLLPVADEAGLVTGEPRSDDNSDEEDLYMVETDGEDVRWTMGQVYGQLGLRKLMDHCTRYARCEGMHTPKPAISKG